MKKQWIIVGVLIALLTAGAVIGVQMAPEIFPVEVGARIPAFTAVDLATGDSVPLSHYEGSVTLLNIWATWCEPCRVEMPSMQHLYQELGPAGLRIVAVSIDQADPQLVKDFQRQYGLSFDILQDRSRDIERVFQTTGVPESFVLNKEGRIVKKVIGAHDWSSVANQELIRRLLAQPRR